MLSEQGLLHQPDPYPIAILHTMPVASSHVALLAAVSNAESQPLTPELIEMVIKHLQRSQLARARLVSKQFAAAVDPLVSAVSISLTGWDKRVALVGLQHVTRLDVGSEVKGSAQWRQLQYTISQLPKLNTLRQAQHPAAYATCIPEEFTSCLSSLTSLTRLDMIIGHAGMPFPQGVQLPGLRAAKVADGRSLAEIVAFAPNLEHLNCDNLWVGGDRPAALPMCTHFGGCHIYFSNTEPAQAFAAAFPNLQVVTYMPNAAHIADGQWSAWLPAQQLLAHLPSVRAVRGWARNVMRNAAAAGAQTLPQLQRLCLHSMEHLDISSISSMSQLQHVCITFDEADRTKLQALLRALAALPQLQSLVLPAGVLCSQCCPGVQSSLAALTAKSSLKQLVFLEWQNTHIGGVETGLHCTHPEAIQAGLQSLAAASTQEQQQQQLMILHQQQHPPIMLTGSLANPDSAAGVWGVYGPPGAW